MKEKSTEKRSKRNERKRKKWRMILADQIMEREFGRKTYKKTQKLKEKLG